MMNNKVQKKIWYAPNMKEAYGHEEIQSVQNCLEDGWLAPGPKTELFESMVAKAFGKSYGIMVNSGSSANLLALACLDFKPGDEIITPACTFATTVAPIIQVGATPVFCDVEIPTYVPSVASILSCITESTRAILLPNLIGMKPDWVTLRKSINKLNPKIILIEDSCDTITHTEVTDISTTSFYASHIITAGGGGGMLMLNCEALKRRALMIRDWGRIGNNSEEMEERFSHSVDGIQYDFKFLYGSIGYNFKSTEMNAAFGIAQMEKLEKFRAIRKSNMLTYMRLLKGKVEGLVLPNIETFKGEELLAMPFLYPHRNQLLEYLEANNVQTRVCFAGNITRHPAYRKFFKEYPNSDRIMAEGFLLGGHHGLCEQDIVCNKK